jgi:hypothetical protein
LQLGEYALAETLLGRMLEQGFRVPSTRLHLARIAVLTDRGADAREHAAEHRAEAPSYVPPRILFFQLLFALLDGADAWPVLGRPKQTLSHDDAQLEWIMQPVLDHIRARLAGDARALLTALVAALSDRAKLAALDALSAWREAVPLLD